MDVIASGMGASLAPLIQFVVRFSDHEDPGVGSTELITWGQVIPVIGEMMEFPDGLIRVVTGTRHRLVARAPDTGPPFYSVIIVTVASQNLIPVSRPPGPPA